MLSRRQFLGGALAAGVGLGVGYALKPRAGRGTHDAYFTQLSQALRAAGVGSPTLIWDKARSEHNLHTIAEQVGQSKHLRIVAKSLPCLNLLEHTAQAWHTQRYMVFNYPMLLTLAQFMPQADLLLGKPLSPVELPNFFSRLSQTQAPAFNAAQQIQWLVDTPETLRAYLQFARAQAKPMRLNIEIDVGLHRGGVPDVATLNTMLDMMSNELLAQFSGLMGYEAHIAKVPNLLHNRAQTEAHAKALYREFRELALRHPASRLAPEQLTLNTAGSPTYRLHIDNPDVNELAIGSAVVKPSDFDSELLSELQPALYIAAPILKVGEFSLPYGAQMVSNLTRAWDVNQRTSVIIHGGEWRAKLISPEGVRSSELYGTSTNQKVLTAAPNFAYHAGDYVFFRPTQSEMLMLQFGTLAVYDQARISEQWPVFPASA